MKLWLADDAILIRDGLAGLLSRQGHEISALFSDAEELRKAGLDLVHNPSAMPDVLISDVRMPPHMADDGLKAVLAIRQEIPELPVLVLSQYLAPAYAQRLFVEDCGSGTGYLLKERVGKVSDFINALGVVAAGGVMIDPDVAGRMMSHDRGVQSLTQREREVMDLMAKGLSNAEIAQYLVLSDASVAKHVSNIFQRLGLVHGEENRRVRAILRYLSETGGLY